MPHNIAEQSPKIVKPQEQERINIAYMNIMQNAQKNISFSPMKNVTYLWVYAENKDILLGVEQPWDHPELFVDVNDSDALNHFNQLKLQLKKQGKLGHPTLATAFAKSGRALPYEGKAFIGGELRFVDNQWIIDNNSGRFGRLDKSVTAKNAQYLMHEITQAFEQHIGIKPLFQISLPHAAHLNAYYNIWNKEKTHVDAALKLLKDYTKSNAWGLFFTGHWRRHHVHLVKEALQEFQPKAATTTVAEILLFFSNNLPPHNLEQNGSLMRRLDFIAGQTNTQFKFPAPDVVSSQLS